MILLIRNTDDAGGIYLILNTQTNRRYVGMTTCFRLRWRSHIDNLRNGCHANPILQADFDRYGEQAFSFQVLERMSNKEVEELKGRERVWMKRFNAFGPLGYNLWRS